MPKAERAETGASEHIERAKRLLKRREAIVGEGVNNRRIQHPTEWDLRAATAHALIAIADALTDPGRRDG